MRDLSIVLQVIVICGLMVGYFLVPEGASNTVMWFCLIVFYCYLAQSLVNPVTIISGLPSYIKIDFLFLLFFYFLFYFPYQQHLLGFSDIGTKKYLDALFLEKTNISIIASTIGAAGFVLGYNWKPRISWGQVGGAVNEQRMFRYWPWFVYGFFSLAFAWFYFQGWAQMSSGFYAGSNLGNATDNGIYLLTTLFAMLSATTWILFLRLDRRFSLPVLFGLGICLFWSVLLLIIGDRNSFFLIAVVVAGGISIYIKRISFFGFIFWIFLALFIYGVIEKSRATYDRSVEGIFDNVVSMFDDDSTSSRFDSFSSTTTISRAAFYLVPNQHDYFGGKFLISGIAGIIPYSRGLFLDQNDQYRTSTDVLSSMYAKRYSKWKTGSNIISAIYLDFGIIGVLSIMYGLGFFGKFITNRAIANNQSFKWSTVYLVTLALYSEMARFAPDYFIRNLAWVFIMFLFYKLIMVGGSEKTIRIQPPV